MDKIGDSGKGEIKHIVTFSGGKDSTLMLLLMLEKGMPVDDIIFADTGVEFPEVYKYIEYIEKVIDRKINILKPEKTWDDIFFHRAIKGNRIAQIHAFPLVGKCAINSRIKIKAIRKYFKNINTKFISYVGIAYNERERYSRIKLDYKHQVGVRAPLYEWKITERSVIAELKKRNLLMNYYNIFHRQGCFMCPQMGIGGARKLYKYYPDLWKKLAWYGKQAEIHAKERRMAEWMPGWTVQELEGRFRREEKRQVFTLF